MTGGARPDRPAGEYFWKDEAASAGTQTGGGREDLARCD